MKKVGIRSVERAINILMALSEDEKSFTEICAKVNLSKATVHRILNTLVNQDFVAYDSATGKYRIGWTLLELVSGVVNRSRGLVQSAYPSMEQLWKITGETINLYVRKDTNRMCVAEMVSPQPLKYAVGVGVLVPLYAGSPGKLLMAYLPEKELEKIMSRLNMTPLTKKTIVNPKKFLEELQKIKKRGWATSFGERIEGVSCLSVPIRNYTGEVVASLNILAPYVRLNENEIMKYLDEMQKQAQIISMRLGYKEV